MDGTQSGPVDLEEARQLAEVLSRALGARGVLEAAKVVADLRRRWPQFTWTLDGQAIRVEASVGELAVT